MRSLNVLKNNKRLDGLHAYKYSGNIVFGIKIIAYIFLNYRGKKMFVYGEMRKKEISLKILNSRENELLSL